MPALLFDLDGTLTDPKPGITRSIAHALERMGRESPPLDDLAFAIGPPLRHSLARLLGDDNPATVERALAHYRERFAEVGLFENEVYAGIEEMLRQLRGEGHALFVATSKPRIYATRIVEHFGLARHFEAVHGCELDGTREDKRHLLAHLARLHGIDRAVMIGDRGADMIAARHHGLHALGVTYGYGSAEELVAAGAHQLAASPAEIACLAPDWCGRTGTVHRP
jgi:phosphoglycolate phosphatase